MPRTKLNNGLDLDRIVLTVIEQKHAEARAAPEPRIQKYHNWYHDRWEEDRSMNYRYTPQWFGDLTADEAGRVRILRRIRKLSDAGLLEQLVDENDRMCRVRLTPEGLAHLADLNAARPMSREELAAYGTTPEDLGWPEGTEP